MFNAGFGSELNAEGDVEMDAGLMDGGALDAGALCAIQGVPHPISVARKILEAKEVFLSAEGARRFARERGAELCSPKALISKERLEEWQASRGKSATPGKNCDTVGCVALDTQGNIAGGASTGGLESHRPGRVGDTPQIGCGFYADNSIGGASMTGEGEAIARLVLAHTAIELMAAGQVPEAAAQKTIERLQQRTGAEAGCILLSADGQIGWAHNAGNMVCGYRTAQMPNALAFVHKKEEQEKKERNHEPPA
jgi:beta-aspartyl-peptidase (threonine type)